MGVFIQRSCKRRTPLSHQINLKLSQLERKKRFEKKNQKRKGVCDEIFFSCSPRLVFWVGWRGSWIGWLGWLDQKNNSVFELSCPFLTPSFIQIGPKLAKLVFWGGLGGWGYSVGWMGWSEHKNNFELCCLILASTPPYN